MKEKTGNRIGRFLHYIVLAVLSCLALFLLLANFEELVASNPTHAPLYGLAASMVVAVTILHAAIWCVFGTGGFISRSLFSIGLTLIVGLGLFLGLAVVLGRQPTELKLITQLALIYYLPALLSAQIPFWIARTLFGWQFTIFGGTPVAMSLRQLFVITFAFAVAFAMPSLANKVIVNSRQIAIGAYDFAPNEMPDGQVFMEQTEITAENIDQIRTRIKKDTRLSTIRTMNMVLISFALHSLLVIPIIWLVFKMPTLRAVLFLLAYHVAQFAVFAVLQIIAEPEIFFFSNGLFGTVIFVLMNMIFVSVPLMISKSRGYQLVTAKERRAISN